LLIRMRPNGWPTMHTNTALFEAKWLADHAHEYGFIIRYPQNKEDVTGYKYEAWHLRYVGVDLAELIHAGGLTLEEYSEQHAA
jgi:D-alanyl-D-alanine carboxypeptidase